MLPGQTHPGGFLTRLSGFGMAHLLAPLLLMLFLSFAAITVRAEKKVPEKPIDLNTATSEQLQQLPGIGPVTAQAILDFRKKSGPFKRVSDILAIRGISKKKFQTISPYLTVITPKPAAKAPATAKSAAPQAKQVTPTKTPTTQSKAPAQGR